MAFKKLDDAQINRNNITKHQGLLQVSSFILKLTHSLRMQAKFLLSFLHQFGQFFLQVYFSSFTNETKRS
jgi:hypothetical protein